MADADVELVVAVSENNVIGRDNQLPWRLPGDLRHFRGLTMGRHILMGRKTYESIGKALPGRTSWVLSRSGSFAPPDAKVVKTLAEAQSAAGDDTPLMVIGGAEIYRLSLSKTRRIHLTLVHAQISDGDSFFPEWRQPEWREISCERHEADEKNIYPYSFMMLERG